MNKTLGVDLEGEFELSQKHPWDEHHATTTEKVPRIEEGTVLRTPYVLALSDVQPRILHNSPAKDANQTKLTSVDAVASADFFWWAQPVRLVNQLSNLSPETSSRAERIRHFAKGCRYYQDFGKRPEPDFLAFHRLRGRKERAENLDSQREMGQVEISLPAKT
ncbi:uncharacterized protein N7458_008104 [Penicillium daleae]|uniref:Uncharacterized protein n=1 Tax=Penicillium daleae TaxID=63821 RepID=A0AAD6C389_9EURO|nr:uncharacterized protein N7458_008104 [Penicillium daleae]KAJ5444232.1 hypothetical protein N7458_008104 [Penicillium daleae]